MAMGILARAGLGAAMSAGMGALTAQVFVNRANAVVDQLFKDQILPKIGGLSAQLQETLRLNPEKVKLAPPLRGYPFGLRGCAQTCLEEENKKTDVYFKVGLITLIVLSIFCAYMAIPVGASFLPKVGIVTLCGASGILGATVSMVGSMATGSYRSFSKPVSE